MTGKRVALVTGNNYPEWDKEKQLKFAVADAEKIKEILENKDICGFDEVIYLQDETSRKVLREVEKILKKAENDLVFIYFSGHGKTDFDNNLCLLFKDTEEDCLLATSLSFNFINTCINYPSRKSVVIVLDCCYSGAAVKDIDVMEALEKHSEALKEHSGLGTIIITSTGLTGSPKAREDEKLRHGVFTYYLIEGLEKGSAANADGLISIDELYDYAFKKTTESSSQTPQKKESVIGKIFIGKNPIKIREKEFESNRDKLVDKYVEGMSPKLYEESLIVLNKDYEDPSSLTEVDKKTLRALKDLLEGNISVLNYNLIVQRIKSQCEKSTFRYGKETTQKTEQKTAIDFDSEIQQSNREEEVKVKEEQERLRRQKEESEKLEESKRKSSEEANKIKREGEIKQQEELRRQREEAEKKQKEEKERKKKEKEIRKTFTSSFTGMKFVLIPAGEFIMGSPSKEQGRQGLLGSFLSLVSGSPSDVQEERPVHKVIIKDPFYLGKCQVTQKQWKKIMRNNPSHFKGEDQPVEMVSWEDAQEFVKKLNKLEDTDKYRLPSEAEWEYACRAGNSTKYSFGDDESQLYKYAWYNRNSALKTYPVGQKKPNAWGLYDMHGNVWEWVQDRWYDDYEGAPSDGSAWEDGNSSVRVFRGGSWLSDAGSCRSASRDRYVPSSRSFNVGFRLLRKL